MLEEYGPRVPLEVAGSVSGKVGSHEQVDLPTDRLQHWMLGCQLPQTCLSLIAYTYPIFDPSRSCTPCEPPAQLTNKLVWAWQINNLNVICNVKDIKDAKTHLYLMKFKSQLRKEAPKWVIVSSRQLSAEIKELTRSNRLICKWAVCHCVGQWLEILSNFPAKNWNVRKATCARSRVCQRCMLHAAFSQQNYIGFIYFLLKTSKMCTMCTNYNVDSNSKYSN